MRVPHSRNHIARLAGGLDTETPALALPAGRLIDSLNYEVSLNGGYRDIDGYVALPSGWDGKHSHPVPLRLEWPGSRHQGGNGSSPFFGFDLLGACLADHGGQDMDWLLHRRFP